MFSRFDFSALVAFLVWVIYHFLRLSLGIVIHPYRTTREIMRGRWFTPLVFLPTALLAWIFLSGRVGAWIVDVPTYSRDILGLCFASALVSIGLWQMLLFYLSLRFFVGLRK
ncbi:MAG: hypothetical protein A2785_03775 [Candidatus Chisholmbacteria bacterium RIFCSPHIGHO2_01_FULL_49_18]|uniref:Uncharacterized protein n=2 Tax=Candidatus Chisholmiibacteriota TaxID=1817900 RepID=A0A1G1VNP8_9BACT|nr:MAG: hypothetical protein A2785_03775 [Candidatus Chisholmbacteria bacterium RIFCSPHIGHO2_01_FULL_49_18]OGY19449.1 MAG: hypothetical protein A3A65_06085 [Candidatus Chisholmbacteria bacterium RIFCSPLOWO2_01_FULL_49_14]